MQWKKYVCLLLSVIIATMPIISLAEDEKNIAEPTTAEETVSNEETKTEPPTVKETEEVKEETSNEQVNNEEAKTENETTKAEEQKKLEEQEAQQRAEEEAKQKADAEAKKKAEEAQKKAEEEKAKAEADKKAEEEAKKKEEQQKAEEASATPNIESSTVVVTSNNGDTSAYRYDEAQYNPEVGTTLRYPLSMQGTLTSYFGKRTPVDTPMGQSSSDHMGIDIAISAGTPVIAAETGVIIRASWYGGYGNCIDIEHKDGMVTRYGHLSEINVKVGDNVLRGQLIGKVGSTGRSSAPHLHFEVMPDGRTPVNPLPFLEEPATDRDTQYSNVKFLLVKKDNLETIMDNLILFLESEIEADANLEDNTKIDEISLADEKKSIKEAENKEILDESTSRYLGEDIVAYGKIYASIGNDNSSNYTITTPYVLGGHDLDVAVDCGGFVTEVYKHFGYDIKFGNVGSIYNEVMNNHNGQVISENLGTTYNKAEIDKWLPGDIIFFSDSEWAWSHVALYAGNGQIVHSKWEKSGVILENLYSNNHVYSGKSVKYVVRILTPEDKVQNNFKKTEKSVSTKSYAGRAVNTGDILFQLNERLPIEIKDGKTLIDISKYYNTGLLKDEPILIQTKEGYNVDFRINNTVEDINDPELHEIKNELLRKYELVIDEEVPQSEIQLIIPSENISKTKVITRINSEFDTLPSDIYEFNPLFGMNLNLGIKDITKENITVSVNGKELPHNYYSYNNEVLTINYSALYVETLEIKVTKEKHQLEDLPIISSVHGISTWLNIEGDIDLIGLNSSIEGCYFVNSMLDNNIQSEYRVLPYNRYNFTVNKENNIESNLLIDNELADGYISIPIKQFLSDFKYTSKLDPLTYSDESMLQELKINDKNYNIFIYGEQLNLLDNIDLEDGEKEVNFKVLDYYEQGSDNYFIVSYEVEGIGGYFGINIKD